MATVQGAYSLVLAASRNTRPVTFPDLPRTGHRWWMHATQKIGARCQSGHAVIVRSSHLRPAAATATNSSGERRRTPDRRATVSTTISAPEVPIAPSVVE